jgi:adenylate cyclase
VRRLTDEIGACEDLETLLDVALNGLARHLHYAHSIAFMADAGGTRLYAIASHGYAESGAGAEVPFGEDVIGLAATLRRPIRVAHVGRERLNNRWLRQRMASAGAPADPPREIALVGLRDAQSRLAVPIVARNRLLGVLHLESTESGRFIEEDETTLVLIAGHLGAAILLCGQAAVDMTPASAAGARNKEASGPPLQVRRFEADQSIFFGDEYLIKGVAGAILWKMLTTFVEAGRTDFTNRELRLDPELGLPEVGDNLEARLVLLLRRLQDRSEHIRLEKAGRGRIRLSVTRPIGLRSIARG